MCLECGTLLAEWECSIPLHEAVRMIRDDPEVLEEIFIRRCRRCDHAMEWDVAIVPGARTDTLGPSRQRRLAGTLRRLLRERVAEGQMVDEIERRYGVTDFYVPR